MPVAFVDQWYTGQAAAEAAGAHGIRLAVIKLPAAKRGLARDDERRAATLRGLQLRAFTIVLLRRFVTLLAAYA